MTPADFEDWIPSDLTGDGQIDDADFTAYLVSLELCTEFTDRWIFDIADIVLYGLDYDNNGSTLTQVRFYPVATTDFT